MVAREELERRVEERKKGGMRMPPDKGDFNIVNNGARGWRSPSG